MIQSILAWYLALQFFALAGLPVAFVVLHRLPSRGYATAKALGLLLSGTLFWWGGTLHLWRNTGGAVVIAAMGVACAGLLMMRGRYGELPQWWREHRRHILVVEVLFLLSLTLWSLVRASQPQLQTAGGEKWMEIAFLNASLRAPSMPPHDPWLSGFAISYYYLGYVLLAMLTRLAAVPPTVAFNLGNAGWFALVAVQAYGIVYDMLPHAASTGSTRPNVLSPLLAPLMLLVTGNGEGLLEVLHARGYLSPGFWQWLDIGRLSDPPQPPYTAIPQRFFWWWQASRTLRDRTPWGDVQEVIDEFPAFSFLLGDMHPHLLALPFVLVAVALALHAYRVAVERPEPPPPVIRRGNAFVARLIPLAGYATVLGALGFLNTWDFPIYWALFVGAWVLGRYTHQPRSVRSFLDTLWKIVPDAATLAVLSVVLYLPFWVALRSQAGGILPNLFNATQPQQFLVMFLPLLVPVAGLIVRASLDRGERWYRALGLGVALNIAIAVVGLLVGAMAAYPYLQIILRGESVQGYSLTPEAALAAATQRLLHPWVGLILAIGVAATLLALLELPRRHNGDPEGDRGIPVPGADRFPALIVLFGLLLTLAPEFVYLQDVFMTRMNTIFKFYFQAWVLWSLAGAWQLCRWIGVKEHARPRTAWPYVAAAVSGLLIGVGLVYTVLAVPARAREQGVPWTLDGAAWLADSQPADSQAIAWLNETVEGAPVIVEAPGDAHRAYVYEGRVSALTGLPTILGWGGHQLQWRGNYDEPSVREADLTLLFTTLDRELVKEILSRYDVAYIYVGPTERQRYPEDGLEKFREMYPAVYDQNDVVIYRTME